MDLRVGKGFSAKQSDEHTRNWKDAKWQRAAGYGAYDRTRERLNFEIVGGKIKPIDKQKSIPQRIADNLARRGIKNPNLGLAEPKYRTVVNFIFGGSRERMHQIAFGDQQVDLNKDADNSHVTRHPDIEKWALDVYNFVANKWGEENIAAFIVHLDETNPHVHCTLLPIQNGRFAFKRMFGGENLYTYKEMIRQLHTEFAKVTEPWGFARGSDIKATGARNIPPQEYRRLLSQECADLETQITEQRAILRQLQAEVSHAEKRVKGLTTMITNLDARQEQLEHDIASLQQEIAIGQGDVGRLQQQVGRLQSDHQTVLASLADKRQKLVEAQRKLNEYRSLEEQSRERMSEYREQSQAYRQTLSEAMHDMTQQVRYRLADALLGDVFTHLRTLLPSLSETETGIDATVLTDLAAHGEQIMECAAMLFVGYVDGATTFAEGGGGGGGCSDDWGRKADEDDREWARRCLMQAAKMMRPSASKTRKRK